MPAGHKSRSHNPVPPEATKRDTDFNVVISNGKTRLVTVETRLQSMKSSPEPQDGPSPPCIDPLPFPGPSRTHLDFVAVEITSAGQVSEPVAFHSDHQPMGMCPRASRPHRSEPEESYVYGHHLGMLWAANNREAQGQWTKPWAAARFSHII